MSSLTNIIDCATEEAYQSAKDQYADALFLTPDNTAEEIEAEVTRQLNASCPFVLDRVITPSSNNFWTLTENSHYSNFTFDMDTDYLIMIPEMFEIFILRRNTSGGGNVHTNTQWANSVVGGGQINFQLVNYMDSPPPILNIWHSGDRMTDFVVSGVNGLTFKIYKANG